MHAYYQTVQPRQHHLVIYQSVTDNANMTTQRDIVQARRERLRDWIATHHAGIQQSFVEATGINQGELSALLRGPKSFGEKKARSIEVAAGMPAGYLVRPLEDAPVARRETPAGYVRIPLLDGYAGMGAGDYIGDYPEVVQFIEVAQEWIATNLRGVPHEAIRIITGRGDSMRGQYRDGDLIFLDARVKQFVGDSAYCYRWNGQVQVKRLQLIAPGTVRILSANEKYPPIDAPLADIEIGGRALANWTLVEF